MVGKPGYFINVTRKEIIRGPHSDENVNKLEALLELFRVGEWDVSDKIVFVKHKFSSREIPEITSKSAFEFYKVLSVYPTGDIAEDYNIDNNKVDIIFEPSHTRERTAMIWYTNE